MKKQIFKLTSILLAMVMVFTMFTIVPISAEETPVSLSEAVEDLKTAWKDLTYIGDGYTQSVPMNYFASAWQGQADYVITDATVQGGTSYQLPLNATAKNLIYTAETESLSATLPGTTIGIKDVESIYFYYKSDRAFNFGLEVYATDTSERDWEAYSSADTMSSSNSKWIPFDVTNYFNARNAVNAGYPSFATLQSDWGEEYPYISRLALSNLTVALNENEESADVSFSNLFVRADANIYSLETDFDWYDKAAAVDPATLNADYDEAEDSPKWQAFITAREAVLACSGEVAEAKLRAAAEEMITSETSYAYPSGVGRAWKERTPNDKAVDIYGDYTLTETMGNSNTTGIWMHESVDSYVNGSNQTADANLRFGDYGEKPYFVIKVNSISGADTVDIGFWGRFIGTVTGSTGTDHYSTYTVNDVKKGDELKIYIDDILKNIETSDATVNSNFDEWKSHFCTSSSYASIFSTYVATAGATANVTIGSIVDAPNYSIPADIAAKSGSDFVAEMGVLDISKYGNTEAFNSALKAALDAYPEAGRRVAVDRLDTAWQNLVHYYSKASLGIESGNKWITNDESYKVTDAPEELGENAVSYKVSATANSGGTGDVGEKNPSKEKYNEIAWTNEPGSLNASTYLTDIKKADIDDLYFYYKSSARIYARPGLAYTNGTSINPGLSGMLGDGYVLPASDGKWVKVSFKDFVCNPQNTTYTATNWTDRYASSASYEYLARVTLRISAASDTNQDVLFSDIFVKYGSDKNREGSSEWTDKEKVKNALLLGDDAVDAGYLNTAEWQAFLSARANALTYYATELEAAAIKDAALALNNELFMKPVSTISPWREEDEANSGVESKTVFGTSNNGDYYTTVNTAVIGNSTCAPDTGAVMYETDTPVFLKDIEDITFSYKVENKKDDVLTVARIWFYNEDFSIYKKDENDEIVYEEGSETPVVDRNNWQCGMEADGDTRYLAFNANTGGWVETSLATIFGDNWKTVYLGYLNESDIKKDFTEENTYISKMSFGFNTKEGASADVSVGSMYIKKTDASAYTITADDADSKDVLAQAREINLDNVNIAKANEFKKLVKAFETKIGAEVKADYIAGNWYEGGLTLKDLSVLSRKNDGTLGDTFCDDDAIGDLTEDSIRKSLLGIQ